MISRGEPKIHDWIKRKFERKVVTNTLKDGFPIEFKCSNVQHNRINAYICKLYINSWMKQKKIDKQDNKCRELIENFVKDFFSGWWLFLKRKFGVSL